MERFCPGDERGRTFVRPKAAEGRSAEPRAPRPFHEALDPRTREALLQLMRDLGEEARRFHAAGREEPGTVPVGAALFDEVIQGAARDELVSALRTAPTLAEAGARASAALRVWVAKHNARRPGDVNWQRWSEHGQAELLALGRRVEKVVASGAAEERRAPRVEKIELSVEDAREVARHWVSCGSGVGADAFGRLVEVLGGEGALR